MSFIVREDETRVAIGYRHAVKLIPSSSSRRKLPQFLIDFTDAAKSAIKDQVASFKENALAEDPKCPTSHSPLSWEDSEVDHASPLTFDLLLHDFSKTYEINPEEIVKGSKCGTVACFKSDCLSEVCGGAAKPAGQMERSKSNSAMWESEERR